ncbi:MAG: hypothetical protein OXH83_12275 [Bryobacterales bacterium]|nr:hypothetical protein [Bryobacterales bacterium]
MRIEPEISGVNIIILGKFNPAIFTPAWFALHNLLPQSAADSANLGIAHQHVTAFSTDWLRLEVSTERFFAETLQAPNVRLRDLVVSVFNKHLYHTPLNALGINRSVHFQVRSMAARDLLGRALAPVETWGAWGHELGSTGEDGGMTSLTMTQVDPEGRPPGGRVNVKVEPSNRIGQGRLGVYVEVNDHYAIDDTSPSAGKQLMRLLKDNFDESLSRSDGIIDHLMSLAVSTEV